MQRSWREKLSKNSVRPRHAKSTVSISHCWVSRRWWVPVTLVSAVFSAPLALVGPCRQLFKRYSLLNRWQSRKHCDRKHSNWMFPYRNTITVVGVLALDDSTDKFFQHVELDGKAKQSFSNRRFQVPLALNTGTQKLLEPGTVVFMISPKFGCFHLSPSTLHFFFQNQKTKCWQRQCHSQLFIKHVHNWMLQNHLNGEWKWCDNGSKSCFIIETVWWKSENKDQTQSLPLCI